MSDQSLSKLAERMARQEGRMNTIREEFKAYTERMAKEQSRTILITTFGATGLILAAITLVGVDASSLTAADFVFVAL